MDETDTRHDNPGKVAAIQALADAINLLRENGVDVDMTNMWGGKKSGVIIFVDRLFMESGFALSLIETTTWAGGPVDRDKPC